MHVSIGALLVEMIEARLGLAGGVHSRVYSVESEWWERASSVLSEFEYPCRLGSPVCCAIRTSSINVYVCICVHSRWPCIQSNIFTLTSNVLMYNNNCLYTRISTASQAGVEDLKTNLRLSLDKRDVNSTMSPLANLAANTALGPDLGPSKPIGSPVAAVTNRPSFSSSPRSSPDTWADKASDCWT